ncbi:sporulation protein YqfD [Thermaerobacter marianensis DSM 12885]|uniref:Sporulation protein YqfD n=1 Tax=Thermaerobacter marianensis (strain ATCC 700841 / DSM 12885 / JCM 10246 / 7p75a) TaxID=644966 RepID=E6SK95_THEM7|nr:sporulation protein YqfD [Thermaerobacter marianensis]ADU52253.1 sporulation protein YqfD [Thermaerobacter marianensis DSM 12885]
MRGLWRFVLGSVEVVVTPSPRRPAPVPWRNGTGRGGRQPGAGRDPGRPRTGPEAFLNGAAAAGMILWRVRREPDGGLRAWVALDQLGTLRAVARQARCRVRFGRRVGWPFLWRRLVRRRVLLAGGLVTALLLYYLSGSIWFIEIQGLEHLPEAVLRQELARVGLRPGVRKADIDLRRLAERLPLEVPGVAWVGITHYGVKVVLDVVEKEPPPAVPADRPAHVVARRPGVIVQVLALRGEPVVRPGQVVRAGQILIRGQYLPPAPPPGAGRQGAPPPGRGKAVAALGRVLARTWYSQYREVRLEQTLAVRTGRAWQQVVLRIGPWRVPVYWQRGEPGRYEVERRVLWAVPSWRDGPAPVELVRETRHQVVLTRQTLTLQQAVRQVERQLAAQVAAGLAPGGRVVAVRSQVVQQGAGFVGIRTTVEAIEDIGVQRPFTVR